MQSINCSKKDIEIGNWVTSGLRMSVIGQMAMAALTIWAGSPVDRDCLSPAMQLRCPPALLPNEMSEFASRLCVFALSLKYDTALRTSSQAAGKGCNGARRYPIQADAIPSDAK